MWLCVCAGVGEGVCAAHLEASKHNDVSGCGAITPGGCDGLWQHVVFFGKDDDLLRNRGIRLRCVHHKQVHKKVCIKGGCMLR